MSELADLLMNPPGTVWPLAMLLGILVIFWHLRETLKPVVHGTVEGLARNAQKQATSYAIAFGFGVSASLVALIDVFRELTVERAASLSYWQMCAMFAQIANPFVVAVLAYATQQHRSPPPSTATQPPFPQ